MLALVGIYHTQCRADELAILVSKDACHQAR